MLVKDSIDEIIEDAIVDAYDFNEQLWGFYTVLDEELSFPVKIQVLGQDFKAVGIEYKCERLKWIVIGSNGKNYLIDITDTIIVDKNSYNRKIVQAYRKWLVCG